MFIWRWERGFICLWGSNFSKYVVEFWCYLVLEYCDFWIFRVVGCDGSLSFGLYEMLCLKYYLVLFVKCS